MHGSSLFETTAEISVAFAGFIGIFLAIAAREGRFEAKDAVSIRTIVVGGVMPIFYSFFPLLLDFLGAAQLTTWRLASGVTAICGISGMASMSWDARRLPPSDRPPLVSFVAIAGLICGSASNVLLVLNAWGWPWAPSGAVYLIAVWLVVCIVAAHFVALIFRHVLPRPAA